MLIGLLLMASVLVLCLKKNRESLYLLGMCCSLMVQFAGILIFISKKGGYSQDIIRFLFFSLPLKTKVQYLFITLDTMGYLIAVGRYLFPLMLMEITLQYSMLPFLRRRPWVKYWVCVLPVLSLVVYYPSVFRFLVARWPFLHSVIVEACYWWIIAYVAVAMFLLVQELLSITIRFFKRQFAHIVVFLAALSGLFLLYCGQDPAQVYRFYSYDYIWNKGIGYLQYAPSMTGYVILVVVNVVCGALGITGLLRYTQANLLDDRESLVMERKFNVARTGASIFAHSIKNQLLANRVLDKYIAQELAKPEPDIARLRACAQQLHENNETLIARSEELYRAVRNKSVRLVSVPLPVLQKTTLGRFYKKYPMARVECAMAEDTAVLADCNYLSEALYNLLTNAWEANLAVGRQERPVFLCSHKERLYTVLEVRDEGMGISRSEQKKIFEPFYSSKNSNTSWGMGLYHVRTIVRAHLGSLRVESSPGKGTSFFILLPKYVQPKGR